MEWFMPVTALIACGVLLCASPATAQNSQDVSGQPFVHPAQDVSYNADLRSDENVDKMGTPASGGEVRYISGGVGDADMQAMDAQQDNYDLKLLFVSKTQGEYLADINVEIRDSAGRNVLETVAQGPIMLVQLPPGRYEITSRTEGGVALTQHVVVGRDRLSSYVLRYPSV